MALDPATHQKIEQLIASDEVVLFMKGRRTMPQCGFSATVVQILNQHLEEYTTVNVLADPEIREGVKAFSNWPTIPQLYIKGEFVGGCDIVRDLEAKGEFQKLLGKAPAPVEQPSLTFTKAALDALEEARAPSDPRSIRLEISPTFSYGLGFEPARPDDHAIEVGDGYTVLLDAQSARRCRGVKVDFVGGVQAGFKIDNPLEPPKVKQLSPGELKHRLAAGEKLAIFDVRTADERSRAKIDGTTLLDAAGQRVLEATSKDQPIVFHCHHGGRSQAAAEHFLKLGYSKVYNLTGGIDAWSLEVDPAVPRY